MISFPKRHRRIMIVDDDSDNRRLMARTLEHEGYEVMQAESAEDALIMLNPSTQDDGPDLLLLDINMPGLSGMDVLTRVRLQRTYISVIFVSARSETNDVIKGLDAGADDYICKPFDPHEMLARVRAKLRIKDLNDQLASLNAKLQTLVDIDDLTQLYNMRSIYGKIDQELSRAVRYGRTVAVAMMDMDEFKNVNDKNDHLFGSFVLAEVGHLIRENIRQVDFAARYGGDEFLITLIESTAEGAQAFSERLRARIEAHVFTSGANSMKLTASIGIGVFDGKVCNADARALVRLADNALYTAKHSGKNRIHLVHMEPNKESVPPKLKRSGS